MGQVSEYFGFCLPVYIRNVAFQLAKVYFAPKTNIKIDILEFISWLLRLLAHAISVALVGENYTTSNEMRK